MKVLELTKLGVEQGKLKKEQRDSMLHAQAGGAFFCTYPMELYGGSPLSFAACYGLEAAVKHMVLVDGCSLNDPAFKCEWTGFLPLHAVVATGNMRLYSFLINREVFGMRAADPAVLSFEGEGNRWKSSMIPVQLAMLTGNIPMWELIMKERLRVVWMCVLSPLPETRSIRSTGSRNASHARLTVASSRWGPAIQYEISLLGIDSAYEGDVDVLELICEPHVEPHMLTLLLDTVFFGLLYKIVRQKWSLFARYMHVILCIVEVALLLLLLMNAFAIKRDPQNASRLGQPLVLLIICFVRVCIEGVFIFRRWRNMPTGQKVGHKVWTLVSTLYDLGVMRALVTILASAVAALMVMTGNPTANGQGDESAWFLLSMSTLLQGTVTVNLIFLPFEKPSIYLMSLESIMMNEAVQFLQFVVRLAAHRPALAAKRPPHLSAASTWPPSALFRDPPQNVLSVTNNRCPCACRSSSLSSFGLASTSRTHARGQPFSPLSRCSTIGTPRSKPCLTTWSCGAASMSTSNICVRPPLTTSHVYRLSRPSHHKPHRCLLRRARYPISPRPRTDASASCSNHVCYRKTYCQPPPTPPERSNRC